jgi:hypothetical protein
VISTVLTVLELTSALIKHYLAGVEIFVHGWLSGQMSTDGSSMSCNTVGVNQSDIECVHLSWSDGHHECFPAYIAAAYDLQALVIHDMLWPNKAMPVEATSRSLILQHVQGLHW